MSIDFDKQKSKFALVVGQAILNFGDIEDFTLVALDYLPKERIFKTASSLSFVKRVDLLIELLHARKDSAAKLQMIQHLKEAKKLAETRNVIAHNPFLIEIYDNRHRKPSLPQLANYSNPKRFITYEKIVEFSRQADLLTKAINDAFLEMISTPA